MLKIINEGPGDEWVLMRGNTVWELDHPGVSSMSFGWQRRPPPQEQPVIAYECWIARMRAAEDAGHEYVEHLFDSKSEAKALAGPYGAVVLSVDHRRPK